MADVLRACVVIPFSPWHSFEEYRKLFSRVQMKLFLDLGTVYLQIVLVRTIADQAG